MNKVIEFFSASWEEVRFNVTWPKVSDLQSSTTLVLVGSLIFAAVVGLMDFVFENALNLLYQSF
ncbi:MAG: preprotein translocase subunit SecE [Runella slithyformis]|jgi:preprotein translocase subunit SecE|nr:MAG: preprotein translocase subunit SecE [Runella slithyformis]TAF97425.1 MAG: preprotein translocase subunit SecE [Runella sp.]TAG22208.1 MAG: preprotein translocase subunit SecE [Cytophagales bacterium]TAG41297.1 MAG: preprotein translocase subunit SecE [Cytophagia bacterium]TAE93682.1 MAG: preprotein translocase subunit SecE [Runella slithyformis]